MVLLDNEERVKKNLKQLIMTSARMMKTLSRIINNKGHTNDSQFKDGISEPRQATTQ